MSALVWNRSLSGHVRLPGAQRKKAPLRFNCPHASFLLTRTTGYRRLENYGEVTGRAIH